MGAIGLMGATAALLVLLAQLPAPTSIAEYAALRAAMASVGSFVLFPSLGLMLVAGLLSMAYVRAFHNAGWAWAKAISGIIVFQAGLIGVLGPLRQEAERSAQALVGGIDPATLASSITAETRTLWLLMVICIANVVLGVWRPQFGWQVR